MGYAAIVERWRADLDRLYAELGQLEWEIESFNHFSQPNEVLSELRLAREHVFGVFRYMVEAHARAVKAESNAGV